MCVCKLCVSKLCVSELFVCVPGVCEQVVCEAAGGRGGGIQNQKQEPHTKMWGKKMNLARSWSQNIFSRTPHGT